VVQPELLPPRREGLSHAEHRSARGGGRALYGLVRQQSCTAGRAAFITGQSPIRTGLTKVGLPGAKIGLQTEDPTIADLLKPLGYATGQFGKNHLGDRDELLPTVHGFDEFFGNLYHLNAEQEPEHPDYPKNPAFKKAFGPRGVHALVDGPLEPRQHALTQLLGVLPSSTLAQRLNLAANFVRLFAQRHRARAARAHAKVRPGHGEA
jgi:hypothetical protein